MSSIDDLGEEALSGASSHRLQASEKSHATQGAADRAPQGRSLVETPQE
jgi:hypothetical protein